MAPNPDRASAEELFVAAGFWLDMVNPDRRRVIDAAVNALVAGLDSPSLRELAGQFGDEPSDTFNGLLRATARELHLPEPTASEAVRIELRIRCRNIVHGIAVPRSVTAWAYDLEYPSTPDSRRYPDLEPFIEIEQTYDYLEDLRGYAEEAGVDRAQIDRDIARLDIEVRDEARRVVDRWVESGSW